MKNSIKINKKIQKQICLHSPKNRKFQKKISKTDKSKKKKSVCTLQRTNKKFKKSQIEKSKNKSVCTLQKTENLKIHKTENSKKNTQNLKFQQKKYGHPPPQ